MCDIFPEVYTCFHYISARIAMVLISVLAIMTGFILFSAMQQNSDISYKKLQTLGAITNPNDAFENLGTMVASGVCIMSFIFMLAGVILLYGALVDNDGFIQMFVWLTFSNVIFGYLLALGVTYECMSKRSCTLSELDWLSGSALVVFLVGYLSLWMYFISIANSYVMFVEK